MQERENARKSRFDFVPDWFKTQHAVCSDWLKHVALFLTRECESSERVIAFGWQISLARSIYCKRSRVNP